MTGARAVTPLLLGLLVTGGFAAAAVALSAGSNPANQLAPGAEAVTGGPLAADAIRQRAERSLARLGIGWLDVGIDGSRVSVAGEVFSEADRTRTLAELRRALGPAVTVVDVITVLPPIEHVGRALREAGFPVAGAGEGRATCTIEGGKGGVLTLRAEPGGRVVVEGSVTSERIFGKVHSALSAPVDAVTIISRVELEPAAE